MAWSLYELFNVGAASNPDNTESNLCTYDIFIKHCFRSYFDTGREYRLGNIEVSPTWTS